MITEEKRKYKKEWYEKNKKRLLRESKERYEKNKERISLQKKGYRERNKEVIRIKKKEYHYNNRDKILKRKREYSKKIMDKFLSLKEGKSCEICGYNEYPEILQFHHRDRKEKDFSISTLRRTRNLEILQKEIDKCMLICPNCHSWIHYQETQSPNKI